MAILEVKGLSHSYGGNSPFINDAVHNVSFKINEGEIIGIIGHTGSGKSTLVQHLNGLLKPTEGNVLFCDKDIWENPKEIRKIRSDIGLVFQYPEYQLFEETVFKDIAFGPKNMGIEGDSLTKTVEEICEIVGVKSEYLEKSPFDLSGGEKRRVAIAGVMAMKPSVVVFDEPTAGLDPKGREDVMEIIRNYRAATNATVIIISHSMEDMALLAQKIIVMNKGKLFRFDTVENVFADSEALREIGLNVPIVTRVFEQLKKMGIQLPKSALTVDEAVKILKEVKSNA